MDMIIGVEVGVAVETGTVAAGVEVGTGTVTVGAEAGVDIARTAETDIEEAEAGLLSNTETAGRGHTLRGRGQDQGTGLERSAYHQHYQCWS